MVASTQQGLVAKSKEKQGKWGAGGIGEKGANVMLRRGSKCGGGLGDVEQEYLGTQGHGRFREEEEDTTRKDRQGKKMRLVDEGRRRGQWKIAHNPDGSRRFGCGVELCEGHRCVMTRPLFHTKKCWWGYRLPSWI